MKTQKILQKIEKIETFFGDNPVAFLILLMAVFSLNTLVLVM